MRIKNLSFVQFGFRLLWKYLQRDKRRTLLALSSQKSVWVETGTYVGHTTALLSEANKFIFSIEPIARFVKKARKKLAAQDNVYILKGTSESELRKILSHISSNSGLLEMEFGTDWNLNFFLDGHNSGLGTFRGELISPIEMELAIIAEFSLTLPINYICIDDWRLFGDSEIVEGYPLKSSIYQYFPSAFYETSILSDIFIAKKNS